MSAPLGNKNGKGRKKVVGLLGVPSQALNVIRVYNGRDARPGRSGEIIRVDGIGDFVVIDIKDKFDLIGSREYTVSLVGDVWKDESGRLHVNEGRIVYVLNSVQYQNLKGGRGGLEDGRSERTSRVIEYFA